MKNEFLSIIGLGTTVVALLLFFGAAIASLGERGSPKKR
jgi:hypothetical protein